MDKDKLRSRYGNEQVLVVPASTVGQMSTGTQPLTCLQSILDSAKYVLRYDAEYNTSVRQVIPYIVIRQNGRYLLTERLRQQGETRLHSLYALGVGGHINPIDQEGPNQVEQGMLRELNEELNIVGWQATEPPRPTALINDLSNEVSQDHLGLLYLLDLPNETKVTIREKDKMRGQWLTLSVVEEVYYDRLESWAQLTMQYLKQAH